MNGFFKNKTVWITGASSGIGAALALGCAKAGAKLILTARNYERLQGVKTQCMEYTAFCELLPADLLIAETLAQLAIQAIAIFGKIDVLINNAGVTQRALAAEATSQSERELMEINFFAPVLLTKFLLPHLSENQGSIAVVSSMAGLMGFPKRSAYAAAKHALKGYFETLQLEETQVAITIISPGRIRTPISYSALTAGGEAFGKMDAGQANGIPADECARRILKAIAKKKKHIIIAKEEQLLFWIWWWMPFFYYKIARRAGLKNETF